MSAAPTIPTSPGDRAEYERMQCGNCGREWAAAWSLWVESDRLREYCDHRARFRLCDSCYRRLMLFMMAVPDEYVKPFKGYT